MAEQTDDLLSTEQAGRLLGVSGTEVRRMDRQGMFNGVRRTRGGHRRIPRSEVVRVLDEIAASRDASTVEG